MDIAKYDLKTQNLIYEIQDLRGKDPRGVLERCDKLQSKGLEINDPALVGFASFSRGETYYLMNDVELFCKEMLASISPMRKIGEWGYVVMAYNMLGIMSLNRGNALFAMDYYIKALTTCDKYSLPSLEWIVHMNVGTLYLTIEEYQTALEHIEMSYEYLRENKDIDGYIANITNIYVGLGRANLALGNIEAASKFLRKVHNECMDELDELDKIVVYSFEAKLYNELGQFSKRDEAIYSMKDIIDMKVPIMDFFDDIYDYLCLLLKIEYYDELFKALDTVELLIKRTEVKNLERKILSLKLKYYKAMAMRAEYMRSSVLFYEITEHMEEENRSMVSMLINMRNNLNLLTEANIKAKKENIELQARSNTDALTGMNNRFSLNEYGDKAFEQALENQTSFAIEILDIDYFKQYNDNYGHQAGDDCIKAIADAIKKQEDMGNVFAARYGGDEFVIIYEGFTFTEVEKMAEILKNRVVKKAIPHEYSKASDIVTISQGVCYDVPTPGETLSDYLHKADEMLYLVKEKTRNSFAVGKMDS